MARQARRPGKGATLSVSGTLTNAGSIDVGGGAYGTSGSAAFLGAQLLDAGVLTNTGTIVLHAAAATQLGQTAGTGGALTITGTLANAGLIQVLGATDDIGNATATSATLLVNGVLTNTGSVQVGDSLASRSAANDESPPTLQIGASGLLTNAGTIRITQYGIHGGRLIDAGQIINSGALYLGDSEAGAGQLDVLAGATLQNAGVLLIEGGNSPSGLTAGGLLNDAGVLINTGRIELSTERVGRGVGAIMNVSGSLTNLAGGTISVQGDYGTIKYSDNDSTGATLSVSGTLINDGGINIGAGAQSYSPSSANGAGLVIASGYLVNADVIAVQGASHSHYQPTYGGTLDITGALLNTGTLMVYGAGARATDQQQAGDVMDSGRVNNQGTILLSASTARGAPAALMTVTGRLTDSGTITGGGMLINQGLITASGTVAEISSSAFHNDGQLNVKAGGYLRIDSQVAADPGAHGSFHILAGATLMFGAASGGAVAASQQVGLVGQGATLALGDAAQFAADIDDLRAGTTIDFLGLDVIAASASANVLTINEQDGTTLHLALGTSLASNSMLTLASDGHGGTDLGVSHSSG